MWQRVRVIVRCIFLFIYMLSNISLCFNPSTKSTSSTSVRITEVRPWIVDLFSLSVLFVITNLCGPGTHGCHTNNATYSKYDKLHTNPSHTIFSTISNTPPEGKHSSVCLPLAACPSLLGAAQILAWKEALSLCQQYSSERGSK